MSDPDVPASEPPTRSPAAAALLGSKPPEPTQRRHLLRFVWQIDAEGRFTLDSEQFRTLAGAPTAEVAGRSWDDVSAALGLDPEGLVGRALAKRETWSGLTVAWPLESGRLAVELSGLPIFDRERNFCGYRGFGICRDLARLDALELSRHSPFVAAPETHTEIAATSPNDAPAHSIEQPPVKTTDASHPTRSDPGEGPILTAVEHRAFRELERRLSESLTAAAGADHAEIAAGTNDTTTAISDPMLADLAATEGAASEPPSGNKALGALKAAQAEIAELHVILDRATDGTIVLDTKGRILFANRSAQSLFGYDAVQLANKAFVDLFAPVSVEVVRNYLEGLLQSDLGSVLNEGRDVIGRERQGGMIPLFVTIGRLGNGGDKLCAVFRDVTQWKKIEEDLIEAKRQAEKTSSAKWDLLTKINHEIRMPLNTIIGFSEIMMEERFGPIGNERYRRYLRDIHASGGDLLALINDLIDLSKIEAGKLELSFGAVAINELAQQCVALMQPQANRERIIVRMSLSPKLPHVVADEFTIRQIVLHLLSNSIKLTGAGGQVIVSTALTDKGSVVFRVRDTGVGMSAKEIATALEPFQKLAISIQRGSGGKSLDLPLTKALAEANRATLHVDSKPNAGTLVEVTFPADRVLASVP